jgi:hypothetical protein
MSIWTLLNNKLTQPFNPIKLFLSKTFKSRAQPCKFANLTLLQQCITIFARKCSTFFAYNLNKRARETIFSIK